MGLLEGHVMTSLTWKAGPTPSEAAPKWLPGPRLAAPPAVMWRHVHSHSVFTTSPAPPECLECLSCPHASAITCAIFVSKSNACVWTWERGVYYPPFIVSWCSGMSSCCIEGVYLVRGCVCFLNLCELGTDFAHPFSTLLSLSHM